MHACVRALMIAISFIYPIDSHLNVWLVSYRELDVGEYVREQSALSDTFDRGLYLGCAVVSFTRGYRIVQWEALRVGIACTVMCICLR